MLGFPRAEQQIPAGNRAEGERLPLCSTEPGGALPALRCSCCLWEPLTFVVPLTQPCPRFPAPSVPYSLVSPRSFRPWGMRGYNSPLFGAAFLGKLESFLGEGE